MLRNIQSSDLVGKTIVGVENNAVNVVRLYFSDSTTVELWAEDAVNTGYGAIPGIFVEDDTQCGGGCSCDDESNATDDDFVCDCCSGCDSDTLDAVDYQD